MSNTSDLQTWKEFARSQKEAWVETSDRGDLHPTIVAERGGEVLGYVISPSVDRDQGLLAAQIMRATMDADAITAIFDAHMAQGKPGETEAELTKRFPRGSMQKMCDEEGACDIGLITDVLLCYRITVDKKVTMTMLPYSYHGKGTTFRWHEDKKDDDDFKLARGYIPDVLSEIMSRPCFKDIPDGQELVKRFGFSPERAAFHTARAGFKMLSDQGYLVFDGISQKHPEWLEEGQ